MPDDNMRDKPAFAGNFDSVDTVIHDGNQAPPEGGPQRPLRSVPKFGGNLDPQTLPTHILHQPEVEERQRERMRAEPPPEPRRPPPPARYSRQSEYSYDEPAPQHRGKVIVFFGCRGGAGATMLAVNTASQLARSGRAVCLVDLDLQLGDVFVALDLEASTSISALAREAGDLDTAALKRRLVRHDSGMYCLSQTGRLDDVDEDLSERIPGLIEMLRDHFDYVIIDGVRDFGDHALAAMDMADKIGLILTQDVQAVRRAARVAQLFRRLNYPEKKIHVILNRHTSKSAVDEREIERVLSMPVTATIRNDYQRMQKALDEGSLLHDVARGTGVARDVERVARSLLGDPTRRSIDPGDSEEKTGFFARIFGRR
jgi:Flp pilus assembly CpaE family ATPase